jgi:hypothetical protein
MSDFGLFASRFRESTTSLKAFDEAVRYFRKVGVQADLPETQEQLRKLLVVLNPVVNSLKGKLSESMNFDELGVVEILRQRRVKDWQRYRQSVIQLTEKLGSGKPGISKVDLDILNDVGDAIDTECTSLFRRMSGRE